MSALPPPRTPTEARLDILIDLARQIKDSLAGDPDPLVPDGQVELRGDRHPIRPATPIRPPRTTRP